MGTLICFLHNAMDLMLSLIQMCFFCNYLLELSSIVTSCHSLQGSEEKRQEKNAETEYT